MQMPPSEVERTDAPATIRVLLLDDDPANLILRTAILRKHGYEAIPSSSIEEAEQHLHECEIAVLDYHLGAGKFGTEVANSLRRQHPEVPIIILSATLERKFGGVEDMHLLKGHSSADDLIAALKSLEAKRRGAPVVVDARDFYYSRIARCMGDDVAMEILDRDGNWQYVNDLFAAALDKPRTWFVGRNLFEEIPAISDDWKDVVRNVADTRETYIDRTPHGLPSMPPNDYRSIWNLLAFPLRLHDDRDGVVLTARVIERKSL
jgi:CheY-like chemotaxis protein